MGGQDEAAARHDGRREHRWRRRFAGAAAVARAQPDGYTILLGGTQPHVNEALLKSRPLYDPVKDLDPIASVAANFLGIAVHPAVPVQTLKELIAYAKANPGKLSYGHAGVGSIQHLTGELFKSLAGTPEIVQVPYRGTGPVITDLIGGQVPIGILGVTGQVLEFHRSGKMRVLAVTGPTRLTAAPELPTAAELGFPGMTVTGSIGLLAPAGTPVGIIEQIAQATRTAVAEPAYQQMLIDAGMNPLSTQTPKNSGGPSQPTLRSGRRSFITSVAPSIATWPKNCSPKHGARFSPCSLLQPFSIHRARPEGVVERPRRARCRHAAARRRTPRTARSPGTPPGSDRSSAPRCSACRR